LAILRILSKIIDWFATPYSLYLILKDKEFSWKTKLKAGLILSAVTFYILDPFDIIPDYIPFIGLLDDLVIIPLVMVFASKIVPEVNFTQLRKNARSKAKRVMLWTGMTISGIILAGLSISGALIYLVVKLWV
jgi:uncharacterized membrane protein YkvA (DUF1232 family)